MKLFPMVNKKSCRGTVILLTAVFFVVAAALTPDRTAEAQGHTAVRIFQASWVEPGGVLEVSIVADGYGAIGQVVEILPEGFLYLGSDLPEASVSTEGRTVAFTTVPVQQLHLYGVSSPTGRQLRLHRGCQGPSPAGAAGDGLQQRACGAAADPDTNGRANADGNAEAQADGKANGDSGGDGHTNADGDAEARADGTVHTHGYSHPRA